MEWGGWWSPGLLRAREHRPSFQACSIPFLILVGFEQEGEASWSSEKGPGELEKSNTLEVSLRLEDHLFPPRLG